MSTAMNGQTPASRSECENELGISIVWRNPIAFLPANRTLHRLQTDNFEVIYAVTDPKGTLEFRLECDRLAV